MTPSALVHIRILGIHLESRLCQTIHMQLNLEAFRNLTCVLPMPVSSATLPYKQASFASCLDQLISLLVSLPLAFIFIVNCYFFFKNMTCITFFRGSLTTGIWLALMTTRLSLFTPFLPSMLSYTAWEVLSMLCSYTSMPLHRCLSPWDAFCWQFTWLMLEASIQTLLLQSHSYFLKIEVGIISMFPLRCVHSSRAQMIILHF